MMEQGMKLWPEGLFKDIRRMGITTARPDEGLDLLLPELARGDKITYGEYVPEVAAALHKEKDDDRHYEGIRFQLKSGRRIEVQLGPRVEELVKTDCPEELYFLSKDKKTEDGEYRFIPNPSP